MRATLLPAAWASMWLYEMHRDRKERAEPYSVEDFLPQEDDPIADGERMLNKMRAWVAHSGGEDLTKGVNIQIMIPKEG